MSVTYSRAPIEQVRQISADTATMFEWFEEVGYSVDIAALEVRYDIQMLKLREWARQHAQMA